jgi:hypothetical protein
MTQGAGRNRLPKEPFHSTPADAQTGGAIRDFGDFEPTLEGQPYNQSWRAASRSIFRIFPPSKMLRIRT